MHYRVTFFEVLTPVLPVTLKPKPRNPAEVIARLREIAGFEEPELAEHDERFDFEAPDDLWRSNDNARADQVGRADW